MAESEAGIRILALRGELLTASEVRRIAAELHEAAGSAALVIDCASLKQVHPEGLAALLELGQRAGDRLAVAGLSRSLTRIAVQARLAEHFAIYATPEAFVRAFGGPVAHERTS